MTGTNLMDCPSCDAELEIPDMRPVKYPETLTNNEIEYLYNFPAMSADVVKDLIVYLAAVQNHAGGEHSHLGDVGLYHAATRLRDHIHQRPEPATGPAAPLPRRIWDMEKQS